MVQLQELKDFEVFAALTDSELLNICEIAQKEGHDAGKRIFMEDSQAAKLYLVSKGSVEIKMRPENGGQLLQISTIGPGEMFGWSAVTEPYTLTAAACTLEKSELFVFSGEALRDLFKKNNHIGYKIMNEVAAVISLRLRKLSQRLANSL